MRIRILDSRDDDYLADIRRIRKALFDAGFTTTPLECRMLWQRYSDSMAAGWMHVPDDAGEILACVQPYFEVFDDGL